MNRHLKAMLNLTPLPALGALGGLLLGCANRESDRADEADRARERAIGERDEARRITHNLGDALTKNEGRRLATVETMSAEQARLRGLVEALEIREASALKERDSAITEAEATGDCLTFARASLEAEMREHAAALDDAAQARAAEQEAYKREALRANELAEERKHSAELRRELADVRARKSDEPKREDTPDCAWCLGELGDSRWRVGLYPAAGWVCLCDTCGVSKEATPNAVRARVKARAASCPSRQSSPDPLAAACDKPDGCGAMRGEPCSKDPFIPKAIATDTQ